MDLLDSKQTLDVRTDPFRKSCIKNISLHIRSKLFDDGFRISGDVEFENGQTTGRQRFEAATFDELLIRVRGFLETLEK